MNSRDRAMLSLLYESGARIGEIGSMRIRDVSFDEYGAIVWLPRSKTVRKKDQSRLFVEVPRRMVVRPLVKRGLERSVVD